MVFPCNKVFVTVRAWNIPKDNVNSVPTNIWSCDMTGYSQSAVVQFLTFVLSCFIPFILWLFSFLPAAIWSTLSWISHAFTLSRVGFSSNAIDSSTSFPFQKFSRLINTLVNDLSDSGHFPRLWFSWKYENTLEMGCLNRNELNFLQFFFDRPAMLVKNKTLEIFEKITRRTEYILIFHYMIRKESSPLSLSELPMTWANMIPTPSSQNCPSLAHAGKCILV